MKTYADFGLDVPASASGEYATQCPQCSKERRKRNVRCLSVNIDKQAWHCNHCGWSGGLGQGAHRPASLHWNRPQYREAQTVAYAPLADKTLSYFAKRGIPADVVTRHSIASAMVYMPQVESEVSALVFPFKRDGKVVNHKYRDKDKNFRMDPGAERVLWGLDDMAETTIVVEGEIDKLSMEAAGFYNVVSVPDGAPNPEAKDYTSKFEFLNHEADAERFATVKRWILSVDNDAPGVRLEDELARRLGREMCLRVIWPDGCKDANDVLVKHGAAELTKCVQNAQPFPIAGVFDVLDMSDRITQLWEKGWEKGLSTGYEGLDEFYTVRAGEFTVVTGVPNSGKSNWLDAVCVNMAKLHGWNFAIFSPENQPVEDHMSRMIEKYIRKPFMQGRTDRITREELEAGKQWAHEHFHWILPDNDVDWTIDLVLEKLRQLVRKHGVQGCVIDPWNELEHSRPRDVTETEYISRSLKRIRQFGRHNGVHIWVVAHPQKMLRDKKTGHYPIPSMYDINGSAHWRNKADNGICIWRDLSDPRSIQVEVHIQKIRFRQIGRLGQCNLSYDRVVQTYHMPNVAAKEMLTSYGSDWNNASRKRAEPKGEEF